MPRAPRRSQGWRLSESGTRCSWELVESRDGDEGVNVTRPDGSEVPQVHRGNRDNPQPFADGHHRRIRAAEPEIGVLAHEARHPPEIGIDEFDQLKGAVRPHAHTVQESGLGRRAQRPVDEITSLGKDRGRNHKNIRRTPEPVRASRMMLVPPVSKGVKDIRIDEDHGT